MGVTLTWKGCPGSWLSSGYRIMTYDIEIRFWFVKVLTPYTAAGFVQHASFKIWVCKVLFIVTIFWVRNFWNNRIFWIDGNFWTVRIFLVDFVIFGITIIFWRFRIFSLRIFWQPRIFWRVRIFWFSKIFQKKIFINTKF